jgi:peptide chain release factor 2
VQEKDVRVDTYRSSGAGGQHVNVTDSAVRLTHLPTGIVVSCQNERSQIRNREVAYKILKSRLFDLEMQKRREKLDAVEAGKKDISFGSQIRSYVLHPYRMVKDHRTKVEVGDVDRVMNGDLDDLIKAALIARAKGALGPAEAAED